MAVEWEGPQVEDERDLNGDWVGTLILRRWYRGCTCIVCLARDLLGDTEIKAHFCIACFDHELGACPPWFTTSTQLVTVKG